MMKNKNIRFKFNRIEFYNGFFITNNYIKHEDDNYNFMFKIIKYDYDILNNIYNIKRSFLSSYNKKTKKLSCNAYWNNGNIEGESIGYEL